LPDGTDVIELLAVQCVTKYIFAMILVRENGAKKIKLYYWGTSNDHIFGVWHEESFNNPDIDLDSGEIKSYSLHAHVSPEFGSGPGIGGSVIATISVEYPDGSSDNSICFISTNNIGWPAFNKNADAAVVLQYIDGPLSDSAIVRVHPSNSQAKLNETLLVFSDSSNPHIDIDGGVRYGSLHVGYPSYYPPALPVGEAQVSRIDRCKEIITDLFDPNYGQVYCNDFISIASLDFINSDDAPVSFPAIEDGLTTFGNFKIETKDDLIAAVESIDLIQLKNINIGKFFYNLNTFNLDSTFDKRVSPQIPYRSLIFMITSNDESFDVSSDEIDIMNIKDIITGLRSEGILHEQGMIHVADFVPRDRSSLIRIGLTRLAEMSGGYYTPLRGGQ
ncbi:hypothetical protein CMI47_08575, partial [Candidatus Pacearchaeota archaeon]|nr:hypothetical protein [Candidatus Pacearchaeota archaeon]